jgi:Raf kinase inhibitor-like YbhB/YbcL family protein
MTLPKPSNSQLIIVFLLAFVWPLTQPSTAADRNLATQDAIKQATDSLQLTSSSFETDAAIPAKYTCDGEDASPALAWNDPPAATKGFALVMDDPDAPNKTVVHWVIYDIPAATRKLPEGVAKDPKLTDGSLQGKNSHGKIGYSGPCPPHGVVHHYFFKLYALDKSTGLKAGASKAQLEVAIKGRILGKAQLIGRFEH